MSYYRIRTTEVDHTKYAVIQPPLDEALAQEYESHFAPLSFSLISGVRCELIEPEEAAPYTLVVHQKTNGGSGGEHTVVGSLGKFLADKGNKVEVGREGPVENPFADEAAL